MMRYFSFFIFLLLLSSCESPGSKKSNLTFAELYGDLSTEKINNTVYGFAVDKTDEWEQVGDKLITNFINMYNLHINHEPDDVEYPFKGWFFGWVKDQCNEGYAGCDAIYAAKSKTLTGPWLVYSGDNLDGSAKWTTDKFIDQWVPVLAGGPNNYDNWHNGDPSVIRHNDLYYMAYSATGHNRDGIPFGQSGDTDSDISVVMGATSQDGINWIKSEEPILIYDPQWGQSPMKKGDYMHEFGSYHRPSLIFEDGKFKLWFDAYVKDNFHTLYAENSENFMVKNDWNIKRGMAKPALKNFPNPDVVKIEELYLGFGDPVHPEAPEKGWGSRKITWAVSLNGQDWKPVGYMETDDGWQGIMVPEVIVNREKGNYVVNLTYGTMIKGHYHQDSIRLKRWIVSQSELSDLREYISVKN